METSKIIEHITDWLESYVEKSGTRGFVVGVSGGIDSALTSTLVARTGYPVICIEMPIHQHPNQVSRALNHIEFLMDRYPNVAMEKVELTPVFDQLISTLPASEDSDKKEMALVNTRARLRMTTLYYFAALRNYLVAGTGNKVEDFGIGFFTKYGDGGVDLSPIADLTKSEVYTLARELEVSREIMEAQPTDGLWGDDRTDEDQIGATYPELEWAMEFDGDESKISDRERQVLSIYRRYHNANQHKMIAIPVCAIPHELK